MGDSIDESKNVELTDDDLANDSKGQLIKKAGQLRDRRNDLNQMASERASERDTLNAKTREKVDEAQEHREARDELNEQVQEHKQQRNEKNAKANELFEKVDQLEDDRGLNDGKSVDQLREEIDDLEFKQQTQVLSPDDERELIEKIENRRSDLEERKSKLDESGDLEKVKANGKGVRAAASEQQQRLTELADQAQERHDDMIQTYREADDVRDEADEWHEKFVDAQEAADRHHEDFVRVQKRLREMDKKEEESREANREEKAEEAKEEAEEIYQSFKNGETLDTEDLMKLQKAGLL